METVVEVRNLTKKYGDLVAVNDVSFEIEKGEFFGLVGPNGAGKTTTVEMLEGLRGPDGGSIRVLGLDPMTQGDRLKEKIGVLLQATSIQPDIKVGEALRLFASFYENAPNVDSLPKMLSLEDKLNSRFKKLSGGLKQRVAIALALVNDPDILFLDELTTGLDPQARRNVWELVGGLRSQGKTIFLTTHYMEEAEKLCDRVGIIDYGKVMALDTPGRLINGLGAESKIIFRVEDKAVDVSKLKELKAVSQIERKGNVLILYTEDGNVTLQELVRVADAQRFRLTDLRTESPNLDDVFLSLTGREYRD